MTKNDETLIAHSSQASVSVSVTLFARTLGLMDSALRSHSWWPSCLIAVTKEKNKVTHAKTQRSVQLDVSNLGSM